MPAYAFEALDDQGATRKGVMEADTARAVRTQLRAQSLVPLQVQPVSGPGAAGGTALANFGGAASWARRPVFNATGLAVWTRQLAGLVSAGLPLERALSALSEEADEERQRSLVAALRAEVNAGASFARALAQFPRDFAEVYVAASWAPCSSAWPTTWRRARPCGPSWWARPCTRPSSP
jgi:general secretion pathway protein F